MSKKFCFRIPFSRKRFNGYDKLLKSPRQDFYLIVSSFWDKLIWKTSVLVRSEILGLFANTLTADDKNSPHIWENIPQPIQMPLSQKPKTFWHSFITFWKCTSNFEHFEQKDEPHSLIVSRIIDYEILSYLNLKTTSSRTPFELMGPKHCCNLRGSTFILLFHHSEINWVGKRIS